MIKKTLLGIFVVTNIYLWFGIKEDPEFFSYGPFFKMHPCPKFFFSSPVGMGDIDLKRLSQDEIYEEFMFQQYFNKNGIQDQGFSLFPCVMDSKTKLNWVSWENHQ
ncbi:hypothetical protein [Vibrio quintilis]|uniref:Uncharacterized protein n=1 Tax=Vibrio quintilis TaxID=1117707 RepID=A0A1M7YP67_9VIBR|nr:hypothetical protein [Vibrio quintilis]SHO54421.1 hypothetical protein VQ7734_00135 [Vibrio quintilis]